MTKVILVDDDRNNADLIKMLLEMDGFQVASCLTVESAGLAARNGVDVLIVDCNLSYGEDGVDLLRAIRQGQTAALADVPVIMTSGDDRRRLEALEEGANSFLLKPYSPTLLSQELARLVNGEDHRGKE